MDNDINNLKDMMPDISSELEQKFLDFFELISKFNSKINLVAQSTISRAGVKHFADSYLGLRTFMDVLEGDDPVFDFGSGNGFPGLIAAMMLPTKKIILVERDQRKAEFLKIASNQMNLKNVEVYAGPVNNLSDKSCQYIISRAMAPLPKFLLETRRVVKPNGKVFLFKGDTWTTEFGSCPPQIFDYWDVEVQGSYELPIDGATRFTVRCTRLSS